VLNADIIWHLSLLKARCCLIVMRQTQDREVLWGKGVPERTPLRLDPVL
jgi:hypothetical protein